jgi:hypothetical protein
VNVNWEGIQPIEGDIVVVEDDPTLSSLMVDIVAEIGAKAIAFDAAILTSEYLIDPQIVPASTIYLHKPRTLDDLVIAVASLLQPGYPIHKT